MPTLTASTKHAPAIAPNPTTAPTRTSFSIAERTARATPLAPAVIRLPNTAPIAVTRPAVITRDFRSISSRSEWHRRMYAMDGCPSLGLHQIYIRIRGRPALWLNRPRRYGSGTVALREIRKYQKLTQLPFPNDIAGGAILCSSQREDCLFTHMFYPAARVPGGSSIPRNKRSSRSTVIGDDVDGEREARAGKRTEA